MSRCRPCAPLAAAEGFVLAGGRSIRMGRDKALLRLSGRTLVELALDRLRALPLSAQGTPRIAGSRPDLAGYAPVVPDIHPGCGPLSGIEAALAASSQPLNLFLPIDLPLLPAGLLAWMLRRASVTGALATYPRIQGREQPLCAIYHRELLPFLTPSLLRGEYKVTRAIAGALRGKAREDSGSAIGLLDVFDLELLLAAYPELHRLSSIPSYRWFQNFNSPQDLEEDLGGLEALLERESALPASGEML